VRKPLTRKPAIALFLYDFVTPGLDPGAIPLPLQCVRKFYVYILASRKDGTLYTGVTSNLPRRAWEHREGVVSGFTKRYSVKRLVYVEEHATAETAIKREKAIKSWPRRWKIDLIEKDNPNWFDLYRSFNW
jgi:putative endonuclease